MRFMPEAPHAETVVRLWAQWSTLKKAAGTVGTAAGTGRSQISKFEI